MKRPFITVKEILAITFFIIGMGMTIFLMKYTKPAQKSAPVPSNVQPPPNDPAGN